MPAVPATDLQPGDTYTVGDPTDPANTLTVREKPYPHTARNLSGADVEVIRIPVTTNDGTELNDSVFPGDTVTTNPRTAESGVVRIEVNVEHDGANTYTDIVEIDRADWDAMTPKERDKWCVEEAEGIRANLCGCAYTVLDGVDIKV